MVKLAHRISGEYTFLIGKPGEEPREVGTFKNVITDTGFMRIHQGPSPARRISIGTGSSPENTSKITLDNEIQFSTNRTANSWSNSSSPRPRRYVWELFRFPEATAAYNFTEVGYGDENDLFSRALIRDTEGRPTSISVLVGEVLFVRYEVSIFMDQAPIFGEVEVDGIIHEYSLYMCNVSNTSNVSAPRDVGGVTPLFRADSGGIRIYSTLPNNYPPVSNMTSLNLTGAQQESEEASRIRGAPGTAELIFKVLNENALAGGVALCILDYTTRGVGSLTLTYKIAISFNPPIPKPAFETFTISVECSFVTN